MEASVRELIERYKLRQSTLALGALAAGITLYELYCEESELLTHRTHELLQNPSTRLLTAGFIGATAMHLVGGFNKAKWLDPYHYAGKLRRFTRPAS